MKKNPKLDGALAVIIIVSALLLAVIAFVGVVPGVPKWVGFFIGAFGLSQWLAKRLHSEKERLFQQKEDLNVLYKDLVAEKLHYKFENEDLNERVQDLEKQLQEKDRKIQELSDQLQVAGMTEEVKVTAKLDQDSPETGVDKQSKTKKGRSKKDIARIKEEIKSAGDILHTEN